jgi:sugar phosphate permease
MLAVLGLILALDYADRSVVGAVAPSLKHSFNIGNTEIGLLASAFSIVGALFTLPAGALVDRLRRTAILAASIVLWALAMGLAGAAVSFLFLLGARLLLGAVTATARPAIISLAGDAFGRRVRGRALGVINAGELVGSGFGLLVAAAVAGLLSWRPVFWLLGLAGCGLAFAAWRLPEPPRRGAQPPAERGDGERRHRRDDGPEPDPQLSSAGEHGGPLWHAVRYVLRVRTNLIVIVAGAIGSFFFAGVRTFAVVFLVHQYGVSQGVADLTLLALGVGALGGILAGGRLGDALMRSGRADARLLVGAGGYLAAGPLLLPALLVHTLPLAVPSIFVAGVAMSLPVAPLDAVRVDVIHPSVWGRAEGTRNVLLIAAEAGAPLLFGYLADTLAGGGAAGTRDTFLLMLVALAASGLILLTARSHYPREAAAAQHASRHEDAEERQFAS